VPNIKKNGEYLELTFGALLIAKVALERPISQLFPYSLTIERNINSID
jgi:hypothetical protein